MNWVNLGMVPYGQALELQHRLVAAQKSGAAGDTLLLLQHPAVLTLGRRANAGNIVASEADLVREGIEVFKVERGGDVTYHGPGQLVGYPIFNLRHFRKDVSWFVCSMAEVLVRTLAEYGVHAEYRREMPGVWVGGDKIVAIGVRIESWITYHGFAFNVDTNMRHWRLIVPCGIADKGVTSISNVLGRTVDVDALVPVVARYFGEVFGVDMRQRQLVGLVAQGV
jgi:lipoate-protein ligase B